MARFMISNATASSVASPKFIVPSPILLTSKPERPKCWYPMGVVFMPPTLRVGYTLRKTLSEGVLPESPTLAQQLLYLVVVPNIERTRVQHFRRRLHGYLACRYHRANRSNRRLPHFPLPPRQRDDRNPDLDLVSSF